MAKLYETIDELIEKEKDPADYCFDKAWLKWAYSAIDAAKGDMGKACLAIELMKPSYFTDEGPVQWDMYTKLAEMSSIVVKDYSPDRMTNFYYVLKIALFLLNPGIYNHASSESSFGILGPRAFRKAECYSEVYDAFLSEIDKGSSTVFSNLRTAMSDFAKRSASLGNYGLIPKAIEQCESCNSSKTTEIVHFAFEGKEKAFCVNDQFALFLEWIDENAAAEERDMVEQWKKGMLICCDKDLCVSLNNECLNPELYYKTAAQCYKEAFLEEDREGRIEKFTEYLKNVNSAIEARSELIVAAIGSLTESESTQAK